MSRRFALPRDRDGRIQQDAIRRIVRVALCAQILVTAFVAPVPSIAVPFGLVLAAAALLVRRNRRWLLFPIWLDGVWLWLIVVETLSAVPGRGPGFQRPVLGIGPFFLCYLMGYARLRPRPGTRPWLRGGSPGSNTWRFDQMGRIFGGAPRGDRRQD